MISEMYVHTSIIMCCRFIYSKFQYVDLFTFTVDDPSTKRLLKMHHGGAESEAEIFKTVWAQRFSNVRHKESLCCWCTFIRKRNIIISIKYRS